MEIKRVAKLAVTIGLIGLWMVPAYASEKKSTWAKAQVTFTQEISAHGREVTEVFLRPFWTLFWGYGWQDAETGTLYHGQVGNIQAEWGMSGTWPRAWYTDVQRDSAPLVYFAGERSTLTWEGFPDFMFATLGMRWLDEEPIRVYDIAGNRIEQAAFMIAEARDIANRFYLYDLTGNGIPEVFVQFGYYHRSSHWEGHGVRPYTKVFTYHEGQFVHVISFVNVSFGGQLFVNANGDIIFLSYPDMVGGGETPAPGFYYLIIENGAAAFVPIYVWGEDSFWSFYQHLSRGAGPNQRSYFFHNPTLYPTGEPLRRIYSLTELETEISRNIRVYLRNLAEDLLN